MSIFHDITHPVLITGSLGVLLLARKWRNWGAILRRRAINREKHIMSDNPGRTLLLLPFSRWTISVIVVVLAIICISGCVSKPEITYQDKVSAIIDRGNDMDKNLAKLLMDFEDSLKPIAQQAGSLAPQALLNSYNQVLDAYLPQFQQYIQGFQQLQVDLAALAVPQNFSTANSILVSGLSSYVTSLSESIQVFSEMRNIEVLQQPIKVMEIEARMKNAPMFLEQGADNINKAKNMIFRVNWGLIVAVIIGVFAVVAVFIAFFVHRGRRKRYQPGQLQPGMAMAPGYPGPGYPPPPAAFGSPPGAYPPPPAPYRSPSEAYPSPPGDIYSAPAPQGYPPVPQPGYPPPPEAGFPQPGAPPNAPPRKPVTCPRCGAEVTRAGAFCPSCNTMLPGV
jgi:hypothetical protein